MSYRYDAYKQAALASPWHTTLNNALGVIGADMDWAVGQIGIEENILWGVPTGLTYSDGDTFTITGDHTTKFAAGTIIILDLGTDGLVSNEVTSSSYAAPTTTVNLDRANLTNKLQCVYTLSTRPGTFPNRWMLNAVDFGIVGDGTVITGALQAGYTDNSAALQAAIDSLPNGGTLVIGRDTETLIADQTERFYVFDTTLVAVKPIKIVFETGARLIYSGTGDAIQILSTSDSADMAQIIRPNIYCYNASQVGCGISSVGVGRIVIDGPEVSGFKYGIKINGGSGAPVSGGMYSWILNPNIALNPAVAASIGIYITGTDVSGCRPNLTSILGRSSIYDYPADGYGVLSDLGAGHLIDGIEFTGAGWAIRLSGAATYYATGITISRCWFDTTLLGAVYFGDYAYGNTVDETNTFRAATDRKFGGDNACHNIIKATTTPAYSAYGAANAGNISRGFCSYNTFLPNELQNGGYLIEDPEYSGLPLGLTKFGTTNTPIYEIKLDGTPPIDVERYFRITSVSGGSTPRAYRYLKLKPGRLVTIGLWMRNSVSQKAMLRVGTSADDDYYGTLTNTAAVVDTWEYVTLTFRFPRVAEADYISSTLRLTWYNNSNDGTTADFGPVQVNYGNISADYQEHSATKYLPLVHAADPNSIYKTNAADHADLRVITLQANQMGPRGAIEVTWSGYKQNTNGTAELILYWGSLAIATVAFAADENVEWMARAEIVNTEAAKQRITLLEVKGGVTGSTTNPVFVPASGPNIYQSATQDTAAAVIIKATAKTANAGDYLHNYKTVVKPLTPWYDLAVSGL
jgi:hypothetical protein